jgi:hypothetical protein
MTAETMIMLAQALGLGLAGIAFGLAYFAVLRRSIDGFLQPGRRRTLAVALTVGRVAAAVLFLWLAAKLGAVALIAALVGFMAARGIALRRNGEVS